MTLLAPAAVGGRQARLGAAGFPSLRHDVDLWRHGLAATSTFVAGTNI
jgi:hypothetical protein